MKLLIQNGRVIDPASGYDQLAVQVAAAQPRSLHTSPPIPCSKRHTHLTKWSNRASSRLRPPRSRSQALESTASWPFFSSATHTCEADAGAAGDNGGGTESDPTDCGGGASGKYAIGSDGCLNHAHTGLHGAVL